MCSARPAYRIELRIFRRHIVDRALHAVAGLETDRDIVLDAELVFKADTHFLAVLAHQSRLAVETAIEQPVARRAEFDPYPIGAPAFPDCGQMIGDQSMLSIEQDPAGSVGFTQMCGI